MTGSARRAVVQQVGLVAVLAAWFSRRQARDARRRLTDLPGPAREPAAPGLPTEVWTAGGRRALIVVGTVGVGAPVASAVLR